MVLVSTSNKNMKGIIGDNFIQKRLSDGRTEFSNKKCSFISKVKKYYLNGASYIVETEHSVYEFRLQNESIMCGEYFATPVNNGLWEMEHV